MTSTATDTRSGPRFTDAVYGAENPGARVRPEVIAERLADSFGPTQEVLRVRTTRSDWLNVASAWTGSLDAIIPGYTSGGSDGGFGYSQDASTAGALALIEAAERYSSIVSGRSRPFRTATAGDLGEEALDLDLLPRCSEREQADPKFPLGRPERDVPIRWTEGIDLLTGAPLWIPAAVAFMYLDPRRSDAERLCLLTSSGCAAHSDPAAALTRAIFELLERDSVSLTWLQMLRLPLVPQDEIGDPSHAIMDRRRRGYVETYVFNATTDLRVPTAYAVQVAPHADRAVTCVSASSGMSIQDAVDHALHEAIGVRNAITMDRELPASTDDFWQPFDGASYMGFPQNRSAFDFLLQDVDRRETAPGPVALPAESDEACLSALLCLIRKAGMHAVAVNLTCDELLDAGLVTVRVIIPELQPLSFSPRVQYRANPRLYTAPRAMGYPVLSEPEQNHLPQPFG